MAEQLGDCTLYYHLAVLPNETWQDILTVLISEWAVTRHTVSDDIKTSQASLLLWTRQDWLSLSPESITKISKRSVSVDNVKKQPL